VAYALLDDCRIGNRQRGVTLSSLKRMLTVLDVFTPANPVYGVDDIASRLDYSRGTTYRYLRELTAVGLLSRAPAGFSLGPRIIELDFAIRQCDPMLTASQPAMRTLRDRFECDVLLVRFFDDRVVVCHHEHGSDRITVSYGRGRLMPLFRGAGSKILLASLPVARQRRLFQTYPADIAEAGLGHDWKSFRAALVAFQRAGIAVSVGELDPGNVGVAAPIGADQPAYASGLIMVFSTARYAVLDKALINTALTHATLQIATALRRPETDSK
jgi:DNA-binding IclR family transcriptional regulator